MYFTNNILYIYIYTRIYLCTYVAYARIYTSSRIFSVPLMDSFQVNITIRYTTLVYTGMFYTGVGLYSDVLSYVIQLPVLYYYIQKQTRATYESTDIS